jgi:hypothetical protein
MQKIVTAGCDDAVIKIQEKREVKTSLLDNFPNTTTGHCANNRLQLSIRPTMKEVAGIYQFKLFIDKLLTMKIYLKNVGKYLYKIRCKWGNKIRMM